MPSRRVSGRLVTGRRSVLIGLSAGVGGAAGWALTSALGAGDDDASTAVQSPDSVAPRPYLPPEGAVRVLEPRRFFYDDPGDTDGQTFGDLYLPDSANPALPVVVLKLNRFPSEK